MTKRTGEMYGRLWMRLLLGFTLCCVATVASTEPRSSDDAMAAPNDVTGAPFVPIDPCRLVDTRDGELRVGPNATISADETRTVSPQDHPGECVDGVLPDTATALVTNVTAVDATAATFLSFWPDGDRPTVSSMNPAPGQPPTPNAVTVSLAADGSFRMYNLAGDVDVIIDVVGYHSPDYFDDLRDVLPFVKSVPPGTDPSLGLTTTPTEVASIELAVPADGVVTVTAKVAVAADGNGTDVRCQLTDQPVSSLQRVDVNSAGYMRWETSGVSDTGSLTGTRSFPVSFGIRRDGADVPRLVEYALACEEDDGNARVTWPSLTALYTPARPSGPSATSFVPAGPCRLVDTRPDSKVGALDTFGADASHAVVIRGASADLGECSDDLLPPGTYALALNVTAVGATSPTFLTLWPEGDRPNASSLNPSPGQPPVPNAVTTRVSSFGEFFVYNLAGEVDVIIDVVGFYTLEPMLELAETVPFVVSALETENEALFASSAPVVTAGLVVPTNGQVTAIADVAVNSPVDGGTVECQIADTFLRPGELVDGAPGFMRWRTGGDSNLGTLSATTVFDVEPTAAFGSFGPPEERFFVFCRQAAGNDSEVTVASLDLIFTPDPASLPGASTFVSIDPCRVVDTRPDGPRVGPHGRLGQGAEIAVRLGDEPGNCPAGVVPTDADGVVLNVTAVGASEPTFLTVWPGGTRPNASSLNPAPNQPPAPNAVTTALGADQEFRVFNSAGSVDVIVDVAGYFSGSAAASFEDLMPFVVRAQNPTDVDVVGRLGGDWVLDASLAPRADGVVTAMATVNLQEISTGGRISCVVDPRVGADPPQSAYVQNPAAMVWETDGLKNRGTRAGTRSFDVGPAEEIKVGIGCGRGSTPSAFAEVTSSELVLLFTPG